jgi:DNA-binding NarL/FixJ family response regulator
MLHNPVRLAMVDDHTLFRKLLSDFLLRNKDIKINIESDNALELLQKLKETSVDIVLLDLFLPKLSGVDAAAMIRNEFPDIKIIIISICTDLKIISGLLDLGIYAYISKGEDPNTLIQAIRSASEDKIYRNQLFTEALYLEKEKSIKKNLKDRVILTDREKNIIQLLWEEKSNQEIAAAVFLSVSSIEKVKQELKERLEVKSIAGLFKIALKQGIISIHSEMLMASVK